MSYERTTIFHHQDEPFVVNPEFKLPSSTTNIEANDCDKELRVFYAEQGEDNQSIRLSEDAIRAIVQHAKERGI